MSRLVLGTGVAFLASAAIGPARPVSAQPAPVLPGPFAFVSSLDLECFATQGPALNLQLQLSHLNPVLLQLGMQPHVVIVRELQQTCVPIMKNNVPPQDTAKEFVSHVDFACYRLEPAAQTLPVTVNLRHLNPVLAQLPEHKVNLVNPAQLCLPMGKNGVKPPPEVLRLVQYIDLECYRVDADPHPPFGVAVTQLNPQLTQIPTHDLSVGQVSTAPRQLCVPVRKNQQQIPAEILNIVRWIDLEKFQPTPVTVPAVTVWLDHLNPLLSTLPRVPVTLSTANGLMVPVAKNGAIPPPQ